MNNFDPRRRQVMAIVNVTDDSFYAAGRSLDDANVEAAVARAVEQGASIVDIGGYSSRPDATDVALEEEWRRVQMGLRAARRVSSDVVLSVDTFRAEIVRRAVAEVGAIVVNDISAGRLDGAMYEVVASHDLPYIMMHMRGTPQSMQQLCHYDDVVAEVRAELLQAVAEAERCGVRRERIILDPGFGFAKSVEQNFCLLGGLHQLADFPILVGLSRKSMIYKTLGITPEESLCGTQALCWEALRQGAQLLRVHDVREAVQCIRLYEKYIES